MFAQISALQRLKLNSALESFFSLYNFGVQNAKNQYFEKSKCFVCSFNPIEVQVITNPPSRLDKNTNRLDVCL